MGDSPIKPNFLSPAECLTSGAYSVEGFSAELYGPVQEGCEQSYEVNETLAQDALALIQTDATPDSTWWQLRRFLDQWQSSGVSKVSASDSQNNLYGDLVDPNTGVTFAGEADGGIPVVGESSSGKSGVVHAYQIQYQTPAGQVGSYQYQRLGIESTLDFQNGSFVSIAGEHGSSTKVSSAGEVISSGTALLQPTSGRIYLPTPHGTQITSAKNAEASLDVFKTADGLFYVESDKALTLTWSLAKDGSSTEAPNVFVLKQPIPWDKIDEKISHFIGEIKAAGENEKMAKVQELLNYLGSRRQYSWVNPGPEKDVQAAAYQALIHSNCFLSNATGCDMLAQAGLPVRLAHGLMSSGKMHEWVEVYRQGQWIIADFTPSIKNNTSSAFTSAMGSNTLPDLGENLEVAPASAAPSQVPSDAPQTLPSSASSEAASSAVAPASSSANTGIPTGYGKTVLSGTQKIYERTVASPVNVEVIGATDSPSSSPQAAPAPSEEKLRLQRAVALRDELNALANTINGLSDDAKAALAEKFKNLRYPEKYSNEIDDFYADIGSRYEWAKPSLEKYQDLRENGRHAKCEMIEGETDVGEKMWTQQCSKTEFINPDGPTWSDAEHRVGAEVIDLEADVNGIIQMLNGEERIYPIEVGACNSLGLRLNGCLQEITGNIYVDTLEPMIGIDAKIWDGYLQEKVQFIRDLVQSAKELQ